MPTETDGVGASERSDKTGNQTTSGLRGWVRYTGTDTLQTYLAKPLILPGLALEPGDMIIIVDSRGRAIKGVFLGYSSSFLALGDDCQQPIRFINIRRVNEIIILRRGYCLGNNNNA
jgi:hypothetical protein